MLESTLRPPSSTAAAVSSQEVSMPSTIMRGAIIAEMGGACVRRRRSDNAAARSGR